MCTASILSKQGRLAGCVFLDTKIAATDTRPFVERLCGDQGWELRVFEAPVSFEILVGRYGFPRGPVGHRWAYGALKERPLRAAATALAVEGETLTFASGVRVGESDRRRLTVKLGTGRYRDRGFDITAPIADWTTPEVYAHLKENDLPLAPAYAPLGISGDCLCGAFASKDEAAAILQTYPDVAARIRRLEESVAGRFAFPRDRWGSVRTRGGFRALSGQRTLEGIVCGGDCASGGV